ncbi:MAG: hypothetical protein Q9174_006765, partial [Haloplaca sp. 1 TL-2023]
PTPARSLAGEDAKPDTPELKPKSKALKTKRESEKESSGRRQPSSSIDSTVEQILPKCLAEEDAKPLISKPQQPRSKKLKKKRKSLLTDETHPIRPLDLDAKTRKHLTPLLSLTDISPTVQDFHAWSTRWTSLCHFTKIAQGSYGAVFRIESKANRGSFTIGKLIPLQAPSGFGSKTREFTRIEAAANEISFLTTLDEINGFVEFRNAEVLRGALPEDLVGASREFDEGHQGEVSNIWRRGCGFDGQLWLFLEMSDAGTDLESALAKTSSSNIFARKVDSDERRVSPFQVRDIFWQVASALAVAEQKFDFEHRDLHLGNICLAPHQENGIGGSELWTDDPGVRVTIIDYTLSRAKMADEKVLYNDLSKDPQLFEGEGDPQYEVYRQMRDVVTDDGEAWDAFLPRTNVLWLNHLLMMLLEKSATRSYEKDEKELWDKLDRLKDYLSLSEGKPSVLSSQDVVRYCESGLIEDQP